MSTKKNNEKTMNEKSKLSDFNCCDCNFEEMKAFMKKSCGDGEEASGCFNRMQEMCDDKNRNM
jgi:hypothetical protein